MAAVEAEPANDHEAVSVSDLPGEAASQFVQFATPL
jgi:hypothetical protein